MADYAVSIPDLGVHPIVGFLIASVVPSKIVVVVEPGRFDGTGILLECDEERAEAIIGMIRTKLKKHELRCYKRKVKAWKRV